MQRSARHWPQGLQHITLADQCTADYDGETLMSIKWNALANVFKYKYEYLNKVQVVLGLQGPQGLALVITSVALLFRHSDVRVETSLYTIHWTVLHSLRFCCLFGNFLPFIVALRCNLIWRYDIDPKSTRPKCASSHDPSSPNSRSLSPHLFRILPPLTYGFLNTAVVSQCDTSLRINIPDCLMTLHISLFVDSAL